MPKQTLQLWQQPPADHTQEALKQMVKNHIDALLSLCGDGNYCESITITKYLGGGYEDERDVHLELVTRDGSLEWEDS
tara:strand:+ start:1762 stop:1995 length:234 start_codon:yes stop_codon:yes gene_type:complete